MTLFQALRDLVNACTAEFNEKGAGGYALARLSDAKAALAKYHRSQPSHNLLFAVIDEAFKVWPDNHPFQPEDKEHLRAYLLVKARHFDKIDIKCKSTDAVGLGTQINVLIREFSDGKAPLIHAYPWGVRVFKPRSISYAAADRKVFNAVSETVYEIIETTLGVPIETLKHETNRAA